MKNFLTIVAALARRALTSLQFVFMFSTACQNAMGTSAFLSARNFLKAVNWTGSKRASLKDLTCRIKVKLKLLNKVKQVTIQEFCGHLGFGVFILVGAVVLASSAVSSPFLNVLP